MNNGILPVDKLAGYTSFDLVALLRKKTNEKTIGHAGTLDPFATGVMVLLIGSSYTKQSNLFMGQDKEYEAILELGSATTTYDLTGDITSKSDLIPTLSLIENAISKFQGTITQIPPMFSAKKVKGKKLYEYARKGIVLERAPISVTVKTTLLSYSYPHLKLHVHSSKGTYIRTLADDLGKDLGSFAHLISLRRTKSGSFSLQDCMPQSEILETTPNFSNYLLEGKK
jgi:tRNA pseudouridine55 synthase